jgi:hypothetical protein
MTQFEKDVYSKLDDLKDAISELEKKFVTLNDHLDADYRELHGNGQPGLVSKHNALDKRVNTLEILNGVKAKAITAICWIITTLIAIYAAIKHNTN